MPYLIAVLSEGEADPRPGYPYAVATLDRARGAVANEVRDRMPDTGFRRWMSNLGAAGTLPESGGTVGPLPDGVIVVASRVTWRDLDPTIRTSFLDPLTAERIVAAYNRR